MDCHREIQWQVQRKLGLHGQDDPPKCARCHPEHVGSEFELIDWGDGGQDAFDHRRTGWSLEGKHADQRCAQCHNPQFQRAGVVKLVKRRDPTQSWLGLERDCQSCHEDSHRGTLGEQCQSCHGTTSWKPAAGFDHASSTFPVTGKHAELACEKCHLVPGRVSLVSREGKTVPRYKPIPHQRCTDCHQDPHAGRLGADCARCHVTDGFAIVNRKGFDHAKTRFLLVGRHGSTECAKCHDPSKAWGKKPAFDRCERCHVDPHAGQATLVGQMVDCNACHDEKNFKPSTYTASAHRKATYPLEGKHAEVRCDRCHLKNPAGIPLAQIGQAAVLIRREHGRCVDCHADAHAGQLAHRDDRGACEACHRVEGWKPSTFTVAQHAELQLTLDGRHSEVSCAACHGQERPGLGPLPASIDLGQARVALTPLETQCKQCHFDPHAGRFEPAGERPSTAGCRDCHDMRAFRPSQIDSEAHGKFRYPLDGAHRAVPCVICHEELGHPAPAIKLLTVAGPARTLGFEARHAECRACHETVHGDQFASRPDGGACEACHTVDAFHTAHRFDHERDSRFPLQGAHRDVPCERCHPAMIDEAGQRHVRYKPLPFRCQDCHLESAFNRNNGSRRRRDGGSSPPRVR
jgi:hypothetical protein